MSKKWHFTSDVLPPLVGSRSTSRVWMEVGLFEGSAPLAGGNLLSQNRHLRDVLLAKGYRVSYHEYAGGHDYVSWRGSLADGLVDLASLP